MSRAKKRALVASAFAVAALGGTLLTGVGAASAATITHLPPLPRPCSVQVTASVDLHVAPDLDSPIAGQLDADTTVTVVGTTIGTDGTLWLRLDNGLYLQASLAVDLDCDLTR
ncbi:hypothetical protein ACQSSU_13410 [Micromonospora echinospora]